MNKQQAQLLIATGTIETVTIFITPAGALEIWLTAEGLHPSINQRLETTRNTIRNAATLDAAYGIIRGLGWKHAVAIDGTNPAR